MDIQHIREKNKTEIRELILGTARKCLIAEGYDNFSLRNLAQRIGYSPAAIYRYFKSKDEIFACLTAQSFDLLIHASSSIVPQPGEDPLSVLKRGMNAYVSFGLENPDHYRIAFLLNETKSPQRPRAAYDALRARVNRCIEAGRMPPADTDLIAQSLWAAVHGVTSLLVQRQSFPWVERSKLVDRVIQSAVDALLIVPQPAPRKSSSMRGNDDRRPISKNGAARKLPRNPARR